MDKRERYSKQREVILDVLRATTSHPTAEGVYEDARRRLPRLSLGTVYRNLRFLAEKGEIQELDLDSDSHRYDGNAQNHGHFVCHGCGRVLDVDFPEPDELNRRMARSTGLLVSSHKLAFYGLCLDCQAKKNGHKEEVFSGRASK
ncbi:MAG: transcriptional repressor [Chloroflexi bacterium]|nr:transcriptional repressor [Chloroflexota bacterium]